MNKMKIIMAFGSVLLIALLYSISISHSEPNKENRLKLKLKKPQKTEERRVAANNWAFYIRNDGSYLYQASRSVFGGEFPRGTNYSCVYAAGLYVAGKKHGVGGDPDTINVANCEFQSEFLPGKVLVNGAKDLLYRGYVEPNTGENATKTDDLGNLAADNDQSDEYKVYLIPTNNDGPEDYNNWPVYAPRKEDGTPLMLSGAAAQTYSVFNDLSIQKVDDQYSLSPGFGLEMELETFMFSAGLLNNVIFAKLSITNKSTSNWNGAYLGIWADPDVGTGYSDDMAAIDTVRGLGMVYSDPTQTDAAKTSLGLDFLQGPVVKTSEVSQDLVDKFFNNPSYRKVLKFDRKESILKAVDLAADEFRLGATAFVSYRNGVGDPDGRGQGDISRYWYVSGYDGLTGEPKPNGKYDPTSSGTTAGDQRIIHGVGPFILKTGVTQDIWMAFVGARAGASGANGPGVGRTVYNPETGSSVALLIAADDAAQLAFDNALASPVAPVSPRLQASAYDGKVVLTWDNRSENSFDNFGNLLSVKRPVYNKDYREYDFEGYRVYRSLTGFEEGWEMLAEYDLINGITVENDTLSDSRGTVLYDVHFGSDNGVVNHYIDSTVTNQRNYYYSVTAYDYQPLFRQSTDQTIAGYPRSLECSKFGSTNLVKVVPMAAPAGFSYDGFPVKQLQKATGTYNNAALNAITINPKLLSANKTYTIEVIRYDSIKLDNYKLVGFTPGKLAFRMRDSATGQLVKFDNITDDPRTFFDTLPGDGAFDAKKGDKIFDDSYYSSTIPYLDIMGNEVPLGANQVLPMLNGIALKFMTDTIGIKDFVEVADSSGLLATPRSVFYNPSPTGHYEVVLLDTHSTPTVMSTANQKHLRHGRRVMNELKPYPFFHDFEFRFLDNAGDTNLAYTVLGTGLSNNELATNNFNRRDTIPFQVWKVGRRENPADTLLKQQLAFKFRQLNPTLNRFQMNNFIGSDTAYSERISIIDTAYFTATAFGAITSNKVSAVNIAIRSYRKPAAFPPPGTIIRVETLKSVNHGDRFIYRQVANSPYSKSLAKKTMDDVKVVPNPYYGRVLEYQSTLFDKKVKFTHLPAKCTIRIFNVAGDLLRTITHNESSYNNRIDSDPLNRTKDISTVDALTTSTEEWDLRNTKGAFVASGMYIALIDAPGVGKKTVKFAIIQEEMRIDGPDNR